MNWYFKYFTKYIIYQYIEHNPLLGCTIKIFTYKTVYDMEMIRLFNWKRNKFRPIKPYIFGKYFLRGFQRSAALCRKCVLSKVTKQTFYSKKLFTCQYLRTTNAKELEKSFFWPNNKLQSTYIYCLFWFQTLIFGILMCVSEFCCFRIIYWRW